MIKIVFFDIDGTLIDIETKRISEKTIEALQRLKANGIKICIATGRSPFVLPKFEGVEFDAYLTFNGSYCFDRFGTIFDNPISNDDVQRLIQNAAGIGRPVCIATKDRVAANGMDQDLADYYSFAKMEPKVSEDFDTLRRENIYQVMLGCRKQDYPAILEGVEGAKIAAWWDRATDVVPADGGKGRGIQKVLAYYCLDRTEALAFGDGNNDIEMLEAVGTGVAMANASEEMKAIADDVCAHVANDGVYHYCLEHGLI